MSRKQIIILICLALLIAAFFLFDLGRFFSLDYLKSQHANLTTYREANPVLSVVVFFLIYVAVTGLSLPGAAVLTLAGGAIFGFFTGSILVSLASTLGATIAFLAARFLFRDTVQSKFGSNLQSINNGVEKDGAFYLFTLRLIPAVPFFAVNTLMGLTPIKTIVYSLVSWIGMLPGTLAYVNAGTQLSKIDSLGGLLSPGLLLSFVIIGLLPLVAKKFIDAFKARQIMKDYDKPANFDRNLIVIGAGSAGLVSSYIAAAVKAKVTLIERHKMGGDCLNTGCVPSKALIRSAKFMSHQTRSAEFGIHSASAEYEFTDVMDRVHKIVAAIEPHDSVERYTKLGVECIQGEAKITSPWHVEVNGQTLSTRAIIVAAGARPFVPPIPGIDETAYLTSDNVWDLRSLPERLVVLGGGPIGSELTQAFARLGSHVTQVEMAPRILGREDPEVSRMVLESFHKDGVDVLVNHKAVRFENTGGTKVLVAEHEGAEKRIEFDQLLVAVGRSANITGYGLEDLEIPTRKNRTIETDAFLQTNYPTIYACGDVTGPYQFTHTAAHQAWYASVNALFGTFKRFKADYSVIPWATFTEPEVARVGLNELEAKEKGVDYEVTVYGIDDLDRAIADSEAHGMVKVLTVPGKDKILGVTIVGEHAGDLIAEYVLAMKHKLGLNKILGTIHIYPTLAEANKYAAGEWKRAHVPEKILGWVERYHGWRRGKA